MAELWVINASPLITLSKVGQLELLQAVDRRLVIPEAVRAEVLRGPTSSLPGVVSQGRVSQKALTPSP